MFADAYDKASRFTLPVIVSYRTFKGSVHCSIGAFIVVNPEGWIASAAHILQIDEKARTDKTKMADYKAALQAIEDDERLKPAQKKSKRQKIRPDNDWITNVSLWWGRFQLEAAHILPASDLLIGKLANFDPSKISVYPRFKDYREGIRQGTSLCKLGFPFHNVSATYDEAANAFRLAPNALPVPFFPIEGILTRQILGGPASAPPNPDGIPTIYLETSTPGLRGQSGGPIFDKDGNVWAIQSQTNHMPLGFSPKMRQDGRETVEYQFLNVGVGVSVETITKAFDHFGVAYELSSA